MISCGVSQDCGWVRTATLARVSTWAAWERGMCERFGFRWLKVSRVAQASLRLDTGSARAITRYQQGQIAQAAPQGSDARQAVALATQVTTQPPQPQNRLTDRRHRGAGRTGTFVEVAPQDVP